MTVGLSSTVGMTMGKLLRTTRINWMVALYGSGFTPPSGQANSYAQAIKSCEVIQGKTYVLRFDAVATTDVTILVYLRQYGAPYKEYDRRYSVAFLPTGKVMS